LDYNDFRREDEEITFVGRNKKETINRTIRFYPDIVEELDKYAEKEMLSSNQAINKLLKEKLAEVALTTVF
jgi:hypothetical protein